MSTPSSGGPAVAPRPNPLVVEAALADDLALFHLTERRLHVLNGTAAAIWRTVPISTTLGEVASRLADDYGVPAAQIRPDVERTVEQLQADGLLVASTGSAPAPARRGRASVPAGRADLPAAGSFAALDARVAFRCADAEMAAAIGAVLAPLHHDAEPDLLIEIAAGEDDSWTIRVGDDPEVTLGSRLAVLLRALGEINNVAVASVPDSLVFHAGAVTLDGRSVLLPGGSNHGKSTLTTALVAEGFGYLTDEAAAVGDDLIVAPFPKAIALDPGSFPLFPELAPSPPLEGLARAMACREWHIDPARVGVVGTAAPVAAIVCPHWRAGAATRLSRVEPIEALHLLLGDTFDFAVGGQDVFARLVDLVARVPVLRVAYSETADAVAAVRSVLADDLVGID